MGTATEAVSRLAISKEQRALYVAHIAGADAVCSIFGIAEAIWLCSVGAPKLLGADLVAEAKALEAELGLEPEKRAVLSGYRMFKLRKRRGGEIIFARDDMLLQAGDILAISGRHRAMGKRLGERHSAEVEDAESLDVPMKVVEILLSERDMDDSPCHGGQGALGPRPLPSQPAARHAEESHRPSGQAGPR